MARQRRAVRSIAVAAVTVGLIFSTGAAARAEPSPAEVEKQITERWETLEPTIEEYNRVHAEFKDTQAKSEELQKKLQPLQLELDLAMENLGDLADGLYKTSTPAAGLNAMLRTGSPEALPQQLLLLDGISRAQNAEVADVVALRDDYARQKAEVDRLLAEQSAKDQELSAKKAAIEDELADLDKLRVVAYGESGLVGGNLRPEVCPLKFDGSPGAKAAQKACSLIGKPYIFGAAGPRGYDCSGLTLTAWAVNGVTLRHYTKWQWSDTKPVDRSDLKVGDLVFFYGDLHHMGLYVGEGWMVHAPHTGDQVRMAKIDRGMPIAGFRRPG